MRTCRLDNRRVQVLHLCDTNVCKMIPGAVITHLVTLLTTPPPTQKNGLPLHFPPCHATDESHRKGRDFASLYRNQSEVVTAHFKLNVDLRKKMWVFCLILNKQSLGLQNMKLLLPKSHDKYIIEACKGKMTALTRHSALP